MNGTILPYLTDEKLKREGTSYTEVCRTISELIKNLFIYLFLILSVI